MVDAQAGTFVTVHAQPVGAVIVTAPLPPVAPKLAAPGPMLNRHPLAGTTVTVYSRIPVQPFAAIARTVNVKVPDAVGVPLIAPAADSIRPAGKAPAATVNVTGPKPSLVTVVSG
jgi:hypothetical protein